MKKNHGNRKDGRDKATKKRSPAKSEKSFRMNGKR